MDKKGQKHWWAPVWTGLVMDERGIHHRKIKSAIWLYLYLLLNADRRTGFLKRKINTISRDTGIKKSTVRLWMNILKQHSYINARSTGRCLIIEITKWKGTAEWQWQNSSTQSAKVMSLRVLKSYHSEEAPKSENPLNSCGETSFALSPIDISINKDIKKIDIDSKTSSESESRISAEFKPKTREERLALDLAEGLKDHKGFFLYLSYSNKYPESLLRKVLQEVKSLPDKKIKKSRGALFNHLVRKYAR